MAATNKILCTVLVLLSLVYRSTCINCYYCNSANNSACLDVNLMEDELRARTIPSVNCETAIPSPVAVDFFCRKIVQTIYHGRGRESELRVTRGCGWVRHHKECYRADNHDHLETVCQCFSDHCNSGERVDPTTNCILFLLFAAILYFVR
ncbi:hypothetical protein O0L34_g10438 [Tuta absoluta]|nr:hypothetical protein O0L34_g10438 [Tuta absoluta]